MARPVSPLLVLGSPSSAKAKPELFLPSFLSPSLPEIPANGALWLRDSKSVGKMKLALGAGYRAPFFVQNKRR